MKKMIIVSFLILSMLSAKQLLVNTNEALSVKAMHTLNENRSAIKEIFPLKKYFICF